MSHKHGNAQAHDHVQATSQQPSERTLSICPPSIQSSRWTPSPGGPAPEKWTRQVSVIGADRVEPAAYEWLAGGRVPRGALCVVAGEPGSCKSLLAVEWAARVSEGSGDADAALIAHAVDLPAPLLRARLDAAGARVERVAAATLRWPEPGEDQSFAELERRVAALDCGMQEGRACSLLMVDNLEAWAGGLDATPCRARKNYLLVKLAELAVRTKTAVVVLARLSGPAGGRVATRELAELAAIAPVVWLAVNDADDPERRLLLPIKNSLGPTAPAAAFRIEAGRVAWDSEPVELSDAQIAPPSAQRVADQHDREGAAEWLLSALSQGPVESGELFRQARSCGISAKTLRRAGKALGLKPGKAAFDGPWHWKLETVAEVGSRRSEVGAERRAGNSDRRTEQATRLESNDASVNSDFRFPNSGQAKMANYDRQSSERAAVCEQRRSQQARPSLNLEPTNGVYAFSACPQPVGAAAKLAK